MSKPQPRRAKACVMVGTPIYTGLVQHQYLTSYLQTFTDCMRADIVIAPEFSVGFSLVQYARNWLIYTFLKEPRYTHLMWIDADLGWDPTALRRLVEANKDIIGGSYTTKHPTKPVYPFVGCGPVVDGIQEVSALPGGFLLMSRKVVQALWDNAEACVMEHGGEEHEIRHVCDLEMTTVDQEDGTYKRRAMGEDYVMQARARALGFKMYLLTDIEFVHVGQFEYPANVAKSYAYEQEQGLKTMWHESCWNSTPFIPNVDESRPVLAVPTNELPTPKTFQKMVELNAQPEQPSESQNNKAVSEQCHTPTST